MHRFLRTIGFSMYQRRTDIDKLLTQLYDDRRDDTDIKVIDKPDGRFELHIKTNNEDDVDIGVCLTGYISERGKKKVMGYYPYFITSTISSRATCSLQRHIDGENFSGMLDDNRVGISLIFAVNNLGEMVDKYDIFDKKPAITGVCLSSMSVEGKILLPVQKSVKQKESDKAHRQSRDSMIEAAKNGDEKAIETLTVEDMNLYAQVSRRLYHEDIYSIVDSCFMPQGIECDLYSVIGEITDIKTTSNGYSGEESYMFGLECNDIHFSVIINKQDLQGEPQIGRRFKGKIWMQGYVNFDTSK